MLLLKVAFILVKSLFIVSVHFWCGLSGGIFPFNLSIITFFIRLEGISLPSHVTYPFQYFTTNELAIFRELYSLCISLFHRSLFFRKFLNLHSIRFHKFFSKFSLQILRVFLRFLLCSPMIHTHILSRNTNM